MSSRKRITQEMPVQGGGSAPVDPALDLLTSVTGELLAGWSKKDRRLFAELMEDAGSELQKEMLRRALAAGHSAAELHAFGDAIRPLSDEEIFEACTLSAASPPRQAPVADRLWAEADPLFAFVRNGHTLTPQGEEAGPAFRSRAHERMKGIRLPPGVKVAPTDMPTAPGLGESDSATTGTGLRRLRARELGMSEPAPSIPGIALTRFAEDLFNEAVKPLGLTFVEQGVDGTGMRLEDALIAAGEALLRGVPVPVVLGSDVGDFRRYALLLQVHRSEGARAFELHDPFVPETVWVNDRDFLGRKELPLTDKAHRRITAIALPRYSPTRDGWTGPQAR